ncbi:hypothetical protein C0991_002924 [Blastosporella zonata]|nr:hypothetical protein C0991_002924 [Blastosporella zonata]
MADAELRSYTEKTDMQGFDQIVAITEDNINASFEFRHGREPGPLKKLNIVVKNEGSLTADMGPPTIHFIREADQAMSDQPRVYFHLHLRSGAMKYWTGHGPDSVLETLDIQGWTLAFNVNITAQELAKIPPEILAKIAQVGSYSVSQLLFNFTSPYISNFDRGYSSTPGLDLTEGEQNKEKLNLGNFLKEYLLDLKKSGNNVVGYSVIVKSPQPNPIATYPPTSVKFQTMGHHVGGGPNPEARSGRNLFFFLHKVDNHTMPTYDLTFSGNWVAGESDGTMAISKQLIWDRYLLPKLASINLEALHTLNKLLHWAKAGLENIDATRTSYDWQLTTKIQDKPTVCNWTKIDPKGADFEWNGFGVLDEGSRIHSMRSKVTSTVRWVTGSNVITISGKSRVEEQMSIKGSQTVNITKPVLDWGLTLTLNSVKDGGLEVVVAELKDTPKISCDASTDYGLFSLIFGDSKEDKIAEKVKQVMEKEMKKENLAATIASLIQGQNCFVFPGGGTFFIKNPVFNERGDLLVGLSYKQ